MKAAIAWGTSVLFVACAAVLGWWIAGEPSDAPAPSPPTIHSQRADPAAGEDLESHIEAMIHRPIGASLTTQKAESNTITFPGGPIPRQGTASVLRFESGTTPTMWRVDDIHWTANDTGLTCRLAPDSETLALTWNQGVLELQEAATVDAITRQRLLELGRVWSLIDRALPLGAQATHRATTIIGQDFILIPDTAGGRWIAKAMIRDGAYPATADQASELLVRFVGDRLLGITRATASSDPRGIATWTIVDIRFDQD